MCLITAKTALPAIVAAVMVSCFTIFSGLVGANKAQSPREQSYLLHHLDGPLGLAQLLTQTGSWTRRLFFVSTTDRRCRFPLPINSLMVAPFGTKMVRLVNTMDDEKLLDGQGVRFLQL